MKLKINVDARSKVNVHQIVLLLMHIHSFAYFVFFCIFLFILSTTADVYFHSYPIHFTFISTHNLVHFCHWNFERYHVSYSFTIKFPIECISFLLYFSFILSPIFILLIQYKIIQKKICGVAANGKWKELGQTCVCWIERMSKRI